MKILIPIHSFGPGGVERVGLRLAAEWRDAGHRVHTVVGRDEGRLASSPPNIPYDILACRLNPGRFETLWMILQLPSRIKAVQPDILFCPGTTYAVVGVAMRLLLGKKCPLIVLKVSNEIGPRRYRRSLLRTAYRMWARVQGKYIDYLVAITPSLLRGVRDATLTQRITVIHNPLLSYDDHLRLRYVTQVRQASGRTIMSAGRLEPQKN